MSNVIAVTDTKEAGAIVYWSLNGTVSVADLRAEWVRVGLDPSLLPIVPGASAALKRAVAEHAGRRLLARPANRGKTWLLVREDAVGSDDLSHATVCKASIDKDGALVVQTANGLGDKIRIAYDAALASYDSSDIATWLIGLAHRGQAVALRPRGGVYFVPRDQIDQFQVYVDILNRVAPDCNIFRIPALQSKDAISAILASLTAEVEESLSEVAQDVAECVQDRVKESRRDHCKALAKKVKAYAELLSTNLDVLASKVSDMEFEITQSILSDNEEDSANV